MASVTHERANEAARALSEELGDAEWLRSIGVEPDVNEGYVVTVRAEPDATLPDLPERIRGVTVRVARRADDTKH